MAQNRAKLHHILEGILGSKNVYYDPPESFKLKYPCIVYYMEGFYDISADNQTYRRMRRYNMTYITTDSEDSVADQLADLRYCTFNRSFSVSDLFHFAYTIFY